MPDFAWFDCGNGRKVYRKVPEERGERSSLASPMLIRPFPEPLQSMADGRYYDTPRDLERTYRADGNPFGQEFKAVTEGAADSGGTGFKVLRVPN
jgi:hypothetical protein